MKISVKGDEKLNAALNRALRKAPEAARKALKNTASAGEEIMHYYAAKPGGNPYSTNPYATGYLNDHIDHRMISDTSFEIFSPAGYSGFLEFGTRKMSAQPFARPTRDRIEPMLYKAMLDVAKGVLK
ncbi:hypothetical protein QP246_02480 [Aerococcus urinae]|uniref:HK97-gp10 family putative phage morphogenesis protein n=1 Tax=Aerococcus urinae TaxID=1376 RepID=UPI00254EA24A|nr:HK97-gp10 family putative phage morphogenesis protein [Aerococcus urinae]MDK6688324.1 hypothetical protein [Aerococcus urinae]